MSEIGQGCTVTMHINRIHRGRYSEGQRVEFVENVVASKGRECTIFALISYRSRPREAHMLIHA